MTTNPNMEIKSMPTDPSTIPLLDDEELAFAPPDEHAGPAAPSKPRPKSFATRTIAAPAVTALAAGVREDIRARHIAEAERLAALESAEVAKQEAHRTRLAKLRAAIRSADADASETMIDAMLARGIEEEARRHAEAEAAIAEQRRLEQEAIEKALQTEERTAFDAEVAEKAAAIDAHMVALVTTWSALRTLQSPNYRFALDVEQHDRILATAIKNAARATENQYLGQQLQAAIRIAAWL